MALLDYSKRLRNLQTRKFSQELNESALSESFTRFDIPENVKYMMESMRPIDKKYNDITLQASENVKNHLEKGLNLHFTRDYRTQGSVVCNTNIQLHSDIDLLSIIGRYHFLPPNVNPTNPYTDSDPKIDIEQLRNQATTIMKAKYDDVDTTGSKTIRIYNKNLRRHVDIVFAYWYHSEEYLRNKTEYYRGVQFYDFHARERVTKPDFPFAHIQNVNFKGNMTNDGSRRCIRLLKNIVADSDGSIDLTSFQLTTIVHSIDNMKVRYQPGFDGKIAAAVSQELGTLIELPTYRRGVKSPNGTEYPLADDGVVPELQKLKADLDRLLVDTAEELGGQVMNKAILSY